MTAFDPDAYLGDFNPDSYLGGTPPASPQPAQASVTPATPSKGAADAFARGAASGVTANFYDEMRGLMEAGGLDPKDPASLMSLMSGAYKYWTGDPEAAKRYEEGKKREQAATKAAETAHPIASFAGNAAGAIALPGGAALSATTMPARMAAGAKTGAAYGAAYGLGEGDGLTDRLTKAGTGAGFGAAAGAVAPVVLKGAETAGSHVKEFLGKAVAPFRGAQDPEQEAAKRIAEAAIRQFEERGTPLNAEQIKVLSEIGSPQAIIDLLGERGHAIARSAANQSPEAREILKNFIEPRFEAQAARAVDFARTLVKTPADASVTRDALAAAAPKRSPFYVKAFRDGAEGVWDDELYMIANSATMKPIMKDAAMSLEAKIVSGRAHGEPLGPNGTPTLELWDQVKRTLDSKIEMAKKDRDRETVGDLSAIRSKIVQKMDDFTTDASGVSSYAKARGVAAELFKASNAVEAGEKFFSSRMKTADFRKIHAKMHDEERMLFSEGYASALVNKLNEAGDRRSILNHIRSSPAERERMELALGKPAAQKFETYLQVENIMDRARNAMGNSTTARQLMEMGLAGGATGLSMGDLSMQNILTGALLWKVGKGSVGLAQRNITSKASRNVAEETARMLVSNDPAVIKRGIEALGRNKRMMDSLRAFDDRLAKVAAQHPPAVPFQGALPGRAEQQDQQ